MKKLTLAFSMLSIAMLSGCIKEISPSQEQTQESGNPSSVNRVADLQENDTYVPNELLVKFKRGLSLSKREAALARIGGKAKEHILTGAMKHFGDQEGIYVIHTPQQSAEAVGRMRGLPEIEFAELNYIYRHIPLVEANDPYYTNPSENIWGMMGDLTDPLRAPMGSQAGEAWAGIDGSGAKTLTPQTGSKTVYVAVIDEGVQYNHPDLSGNVRGNPLEVADRRDNDGNGKVFDDGVR